MPGLQSPEDPRLGHSIQAIVYDYGALDLAYTIFRVALFCCAVAFWILYFHETWFRSGKIRTRGLKRGLAHLLVMLSIAIATFLVLSVISGFHFSFHPLR